MSKVCHTHVEQIPNEHDGHNVILPRTSSQAKTDGIFILKQKYTRELVSKFCPKNTKSLRVLMSMSCQLTLDEGEPIDPTQYRRIIRSLLYLTASIPNFSYAVDVYARFQSKPKKSHLEANKRIIRYLKGTKSLGVCYPPDDSLELKG